MSGGAIAGILIDSIVQAFWKLIPQDAQGCFWVSAGGGGGGGLSGGAIAGIVIGSIVGVLLLAVLLAWLIKRRHVKATSSFHKYMDEVPVTATAAGTGNAQLNGHSTI